MSKHLLFLAFVFGSFIGIGQELDKSNFFLIRKAGDQVILEKQTINKGHSIEFNDESILSYIMVFDPGSKSGELIQPENGQKSIVVRFDGQQLHVNITKKDGSKKEMPVIDIQKAKELIIRLNITGHDGYKTAYRIVNYDKIIEDDGPVIDMFAGRIPLQPEQFSLLTEAYKAEKIVALIGEANIDIIHNWMVLNCLLENGEEALFIIDFGADGTVITKEVLPETCAIRPFLMVEHSAEGTKYSNAVVQGGSGAVENIMGKANLKSFHFGSITIEDIDVSVLEGFPEKIREFGICGIIGRDILEQAELIKIKNLNNNSKPLISLTTKQSKTNEPDHTLQLKKAGGHYFIKGKVANKNVNNLMDTGAGKSFIDKNLIETNSIPFELQNQEISVATGLDGKGMEYQSIKINDVYVGDIYMPVMEFELTDLSIFKTMGLQKDAVLLGMDFFLKFNLIEFAMDEEAVYLWK